MQIIGPLWMNFIFVHNGQEYKPVTVSIAAITTVTLRCYVANFHCNDLKGLTQ